MGRHSAPDDGAESAAASPAGSSGPLLTVPAPPGRHAHDDAGQARGIVVPVLPPVAAPGSAPDLVADADRDPVEDDAITGPIGVRPVELTDAPVDETAAKPAKRPGTAGDLALVRQDTAVRARVIAAVLVPFVVYAVVLAAVGATVRQGLLWIVVPLVVAGVLVGVFLDIGHKRHGVDQPVAEAADEPADEPAEVPTEPTNGH